LNKAQSTTSSTKFTKKQPLKLTNLEIHGQKKINSICTSVKLPADGCTGKSVSCIFDKKIIFVKARL
jgi:hypothetical protein